MFGLGTPELIVILAIAFLVFGGKKLPEIGAGLGKAITSFKKGIKEAEDLPDLKEMAEVKQKVDQAKNIGNVLK